MTDTSLRFAFGKNWQHFNATALNPQRVANAVDTTQRLLKVDHLRGKTFLDIGCGSGLFSLVACLLGAERIVSFDYDVDSVQASIRLRDTVKISADKWQILQGSVLDTTFLATIEPADVVYSWGVLHHTGNMWLAIENAVRLVKPGGLLSIALYNQVDSRIGGSRYWQTIKRSYCRSARPVQIGMEAAYTGYRVLRILARFANPLSEAAEYKQYRGMSMWHDFVDWLGGYPYEYTTAGVVFEYVMRLGKFKLITLNTTSTLGCNEFTFQYEE